MDVINYVPGPRFYRKLIVFILWALISQYGHALKQEVDLTI